MNTKHWIKIESILDEALQLPARSQDAYIRDACGSNTILYNDVINYRNAIRESEEAHFLQKASKDNQALIQDLATEKTNSEFIGRQIGVFQITEKIGAGGMSGVFRAIRVDGDFEQQVAIKLVPKGFHSQATIKRFQLEKQILARLSHPNIARLFDGGVTDDQHPYLIMEYIDGMPIDEYCNHHKLGIKQRLQIFKKVCGAVEYAHRNLIIHRDLKTKNIYVTKNGQVKVLDFGIAKLLDPKLSDDELINTQAGYRFWTPHYAAPEQITGGSITTATDVYSLGILLYRLLTNSYPYDFTDKSMAEIRTQINNQSPRTLIQSLQESGYDTAQQRDTTMGELKKISAGDLQAIIFKAISYIPEERYGSVGQLVGDITKYEEHQPVDARKNNLLYRLKKFSGRHKASIGIIAGIIILIGTLTVVYTYQLAKKEQQASFEADKARQVENLLTDIFKQSSPFHQPETGITIKEVLDEGSKKINHKLMDKPIVKAELSGLMGQIYTNLGLYKQGKPLLTSAIAVQEAAKTKEPRLYIKNLSRLAYLLFRKEEYDKSEQLYLQAIQQAQGIYTADSPDLAPLYHDIALLYDEMGKRKKAARFYQKALKLVPADQKSLKAEILGDWGLIYQKQDQFPRAMKLMKEGLDIQQALPETLSPAIANSINDLAFTYQRYGKLQKADSLHQIALAMREQLFGPNHPHIASSLVRYGLLKIREGELEQAEPMLKRGYNILHKRLPPNHWQVLSARGALALCRGLQGDTEHNKRILEGVYKEFGKRFGNNDWRTREAKKAFLALTYRSGK